MGATEITVILSCQNQGRHLKPSTASLEAAIEKAASELSVNIEWLISADSPCPETEEFLQNHLPSQARRLTSNTGDPLTALNQAVGAAQGRFVTIVGGDDLISSNWLTKAYALSSSQSNNIVFHPGMIVVYGERCFLFVPPEQENLDRSRELLFARNLWPGIAFGAKEIFVANTFSQVSQFGQISSVNHPSQSSQPDNVHGFGHSDWQWVCNTAADNVLHKAVPGTFSCCHERNKHTCVVTDDHTLLMPPSKLFQLFQTQGRP